MQRHSSGSSSLDTEPGTQDDYDPETTALILGEAAGLLRAMGFAANHAVLIGGLVPGLLVPDPPAGLDAHLGTTDLDVCLSVALIEGDTAEYERIETELKRAGYEMTDMSFRWKRSRGIGVTVEFFCPADTDRPAGAMFRPASATSPRAKHNLGPRLSALALDAGYILSQDVVVVTRPVDLPDDGGLITFDFRVTGIVGFLVAKVSALYNRDKAKDAYDIVWLLEAWDDGPTGAGRAVASHPLYDNEDVRRELKRLFDAFGTPDGVGPHSYMRFLARDGASADERSQLTRRAHGAAEEFRTGLG